TGRAQRSSGAGLRLPWGCADHPQRRHEDRRLRLRPSCWENARGFFCALNAQRWRSEGGDLLCGDRRLGLYRARYGRGQQLGGLGSPLLGEEGGRREQYFTPAGKDRVEALSHQLSAFSKALWLI